MTKLTNAWIQNDRVLQSLMYLKTARFDTKASYKLNYFYDKILSQQKNFQSEHIKLLHKHGMKDDAGSYLKEVDSEGKEIGYKIKDIKSFSEEYQALLNSEFEVGSHPFYAFQLIDAKLSAEDLQVLAPIIADVENLGN